LILPEKRAFCDTSFFYASLTPDDAHYASAGRILALCKENSITLFTTWDIISETVTLLRYRARYSLAVEFLENLKPALAIVHYDDSVRLTAEEIFKKLSKDKKISFCDAISYVVITNLLDNIPCFTFDSDFRSLGLIVYP
jgi:predicted nucleic acid-binding protein